jgi:hypothetical protein
VGLCRGGLSALTDELWLSVPVLEVIAAVAAVAALLVSVAAFLYSRRSTLAAERSATEAKRSADAAERSVDVAEREEERARAEADERAVRWDYKRTGQAEATLTNVGEGTAFDVRVEVPPVDVRHWRPPDRRGAADRWTDAGPGLPEDERAARQPRHCLLAKPAGRDRADAMGGRPVTTSHAAALDRAHPRSDSVLSRSPSDYRLAAEEILPLPAFR